MLTGEGVFVLCLLPLVGGVLFALGIMVLTDVEPPGRNVAPNFVEQSTAGHEDHSNYSRSEH